MVSPPRSKRGAPPPHHSLEECRKSFCRFFAAVSGRLLIRKVGDNTRRNYLGQEVLVTSKPRVSPLSTQDVRLFLAALGTGEAELDHFCAAIAAFEDDLSLQSTDDVLSSPPITPPSLAASPPGSTFRRPSFSLSAPGTALLDPTVLVSPPAPSTLFVRRSSAPAELHTVALVRSGFTPPPPLLAVEGSTTPTMRAKLTPTHLDMRSPGFRVHTPLTAPRAEPHKFASVETPHSYSAVALRRPPIETLSVTELAEQAAQEFIAAACDHASLLQLVDVATSQDRFIAVRPTSVAAHMAIDSGCPTKPGEIKNKTSKPEDCILNANIRWEKVGAVVHYNPTEHVQEHAPITAMTSDFEIRIRKLFAAKLVQLQVEDEACERRTKHVRSEARALAIEKAHSTFAQTVADAENLFSVTQEEYELEQTIAFAKLVHENALAQAGEDCFIGVAGVSTLRRFFPEGLTPAVVAKLEKSFVERTKEYFTQDPLYHAEGKFEDVVEVRGPYVYLRREPTEEIYGDHDLFGYARARDGHCVVSRHEDKDLTRVLRGLDRFQAQHGPVYYWHPKTGADKSLGATIIDAHSSTGKAEPILVACPSGQVRLCFFEKGLHGDRDCFVSVWERPLACRAWLSQTFSGAALLKIQTVARYFTVLQQKADGIF